MTDKLYYELNVEIERGSSIEELEEKLDEALMSLYEVETVESVLVRDLTPPIDEDMDELLSVIDNIDNSNIRCSIDLVKELEG